MSSTPGKTKHFQTILLSNEIILCDCPGLVFPQFATTKADLVCDGVLSIDQLKEHTGPVSLLVKRLPQEILEATYGLNLKSRGLEKSGDGSVTAESFLVAYASMLISFCFMEVLLFKFNYKQSAVDTRNLAKATQMKPVQPDIY